jgi:hypothetical protein
MATDTHHQAAAVNILLPPALTPPDVEFTAFAHVLEQTAAERANRVCLVAFGASWSPPALDSCRYGLAWL